MFCNLFPSTVKPIDVPSSCTSRHVGGAHPDASRYRCAECCCLWGMDATSSARQTSAQCVIVVPNSMCAKMVTVREAKCMLMTPAKKIAAFESRALMACAVSSSWSAIAKARAAAEVSAQSGYEAHLTLDGGRRCIKPWCHLPGAIPSSALHGRDGMLSGRRFQERCGLSWP